MCILTDERFFEVHAEYQKTFEEKSRKDVKGVGVKRSFCLSAVVLRRMQCFCKKYVYAKCLY